MILLHWLAGPPRLRADDWYDDNDNSVPLADVLSIEADVRLSRAKYAHQLIDQNWRYSALKYVGFNPADQFTFS